MEVRSSRRLRTLVTQMALRGLSANEIAGALIPMMARARRSNQRPDTLMQDRYRQLDEILLLRTAGPYIGSFATEPFSANAEPMSAPSPIATVPAVSPNCRDVPKADILRPSRA